MKTLLPACVVVALMSSRAVAQPPDTTATASTQDGNADDERLLTPTGHEVNVGVGRYTYTEPGALQISIHGTKVSGEYTGTLRLSERRHWFVQANLRGTLGNVTYDGWCSPWLITPNSTSPNGYELDIGDASPCSETGDKDWYVEGRAIVGRDFVAHGWGWSPYTGLGLRHLSNGTAGVGGYRTDTYLYPPFGLTARTTVTGHRTLSLTLEYDRLLHGWQTTRNSELGGGEVPATPTAPAFTLEGLSDISFSQHRGWALRAGAKYQLTRRWSVEPYFVHWSVGASPVADGTATFTVNHVTAQEQLGFYEPDNTTNEFDVRFGFRF